MNTENLKIRKIKGKIYLKTGLHIGGGTEGIEIGGIDNPVIKDPKTGYPYIPGSSLKGKVRSLLELNMDRFDKSEGEPCQCGKADCIICKVFGNTKKESKAGITRAIFRDAFLSNESIEILKKRNLSATEAKYENTINRITGKASNPRQSERVLAGLSFDFEISVRIFKEDGEGDEIIDILKKGLKLLESDALGGSGSRGYGKVEFKDLTLDGNPLS